MERKILQNTFLPNGLSSALKIFTKIVKPVYAHLRSIGHICMGHIDHSLFIGQNFNSFERNVVDTVSLFTNLGFTNIFWPVKSVFQSQQKIDFLGFCIKQSQHNTLRLKPWRSDLLMKTCSTKRKKGFHISNFPAMEFAEMHYRDLEHAKNDAIALRKGKGDFDAPMTLSSQSRTELTWWVYNILTSTKAISHGNSDLILTTNASNEGWGAVCGYTSTMGDFGVLKCKPTIKLSWITRCTEIPLLHLYWDTPWFSLITPLLWQTSVLWGY